MNAFPLPVTISLEEYLEMENASELRHEFVGGVVRAMAGAGPNHVDIVENLNLSIGTTLRDKGCRGSSSDQRVHIEETGDTVYPDYLIKCPPYRFADKDPIALMNPRVVFEILSKSTEIYDRTIKFDLYKSIPECTDYILIAASRIRVEHYRRTGENEWTLTTYVWRHEELVLNNLEVSVPLGEIYDRIDVPEGMILLDQDGQQLP